MKYSLLGFTPLVCLTSDVLPGGGDGTPDSLSESRVGPRASRGGCKRIRDGHRERKGPRGWRSSRGRLGETEATGSLKR